MRITTLPALQSLQDETMVYAAIVGAVCLFLNKVDSILPL